MKWLRIYAFISVLALLSGCIFNSHTLSVEIVSITPDKTVYYSGNTMKLDIMLKASKALQNVTIRITGLKNSVGQVLLNKSMVVSLVKGINNVTFKYKMPYCSPCMKLDPGIYPINVTVLYNDGVIAKGTENITLKR